MLWTLSSRAHKTTKDQNLIKHAGRQGLKREKREREGVVCVCGSCCGETSKNRQWQQQVAVKVIRWNKRTCLPNWPRRVSARRVPTRERCAFRIAGREWNAWCSGSERRRLPNPATPLLLLVSLIFFFYFFLLSESPCTPPFEPLATTLDSAMGGCSQTRTQTPDLAVW